MTMADIEKPALKAEVENGEYVSDGIEVESGELVTVDNTHGDTRVLHDLPTDEERRILRKIDFRVVPLLAFLYLVSFVDRSNSK